MSYYCVLFCVAGLIHQAFSASATLPKNFQKCKKSDPNIGNCLKHAVADAIQKMKDDGVPSLGVFPLDPLLVEKLHIAAGSPQSPIHLDMQFSNLKFIGLSQMNLMEYFADLKNGKLRTFSISPRVVMEGDYVADGKVLILPLTGNGKCRFVLDGVEATCDLTFKPVKKNGQTYWIIQEYNIKIKPKDAAFHFDGLLNGNKEINTAHVTKHWFPAPPPAIVSLHSGWKGIGGIPVLGEYEEILVMRPYVPDLAQKYDDGINNIVNENKELFLETVLPQFEIALGAIFKDITARIFNKVPFDNIFE